MVVRVTRFSNVFQTFVFTENGFPAEPSLVIKRSEHCLQLRIVRSGKRQFTVEAKVQEKASEAESTKRWQF